MVLFMHYVMSRPSPLGGKFIFRFLLPLLFYSSCKQNRRTFKKQVDPNKINSSKAKRIKKNDSKNTNT